MAKYKSTMFCEMKPGTKVIATDTDAFDNDKVGYLHGIFRKLHHEYNGLLCEIEIDLSEYDKAGFIYTPMGDVDNKVNIRFKKEDVVIDTQYYRDKKLSELLK